MSLRSSNDLPGEPGAKGGYDPAFFDELARVEDKHFWFRARNRLILKVTRKIMQTLGQCNLVVEVGCGTGNVLRVLKQASPQSLVVGIELWFDGLRHARKRSDAPLIQAHIRNWPIGRPADLLCLFDVLEHIPDDRETLAQLRNHLAPGGCLLLTVPAHQSLWSYFDEAAQHCRRYSPESIATKITEAGFQVEFLSQFMATIFPLVWTFRKMRGRRRESAAAARAKTDDEFKIVPLANQLLTAILSLESEWLARGHHLPFGTSLIVVARKPR